MKKTPLLNVALSRVIAGMGHGDICLLYTSDAADE